MRFKRQNEQQCRISLTILDAKELKHKTCTRVTAQVYVHLRTRAHVEIAHVQNVFAEAKEFKEKFEAAAAINSKLFGIGEGGSKAKEGEKAETKEQKEDSDKTEKKSDETSTATKTTEATKAETAEKESKQTEKA